MPNTLSLRSLFIAGAATAFACSAIPAAAAAPTASEDGEWLTVSGSVVSTAPESFILDYGAHTIRVEMDDYDWYNENAVVAGDKVVVSGRMDADFWESRKIEAATVYVKSLNTFFTASALDEEGAALPVWAIDPLTDGESVTLTGTVQAIDGEELTLDAGLYNYTVDTGPLDYDPLDNDGPQRITAGDRVTVYGRMDDADLFDTREIDARAITELG